MTESLIGKYKLTNLQTYETLQTHKLTNYKLTNLQSLRRCYFTSLRVPPPPVGVGGGFGVVHGLPPPPVGVGWVVGARLVSGFVENLSTLHLR